MQHLAIVIDDRIVAVPFVDFREAPVGIDSAGGAQITGGLTPETTRRPPPSSARGGSPALVSP